MKTLKSGGYGYLRLVPETKLERSMLEMLIQAHFTKKSIRLYGEHNVDEEPKHPGEFSVTGEWDEEGRMKVIAMFTMPKEEADSDYPLDWQKLATFWASVEDQGDEPRVCYDAEMLNFHGEKYMAHGTADHFSWATVFSPPFQLADLR